MALKLNEKLIKKYRQDHLWSQSQLALVSNLSLRTIQRIEKTGVASLESAAALASVFETKMEVLMQADRVATRLSKKRIKLTFSTFLVLLGFIFYFPVAAKPIMVDVKLKSHEEPLADIQLLNEAGKESEMRVDGLLRIVIKASQAMDNQIILDTKFYRVQPKGEKLIGTPRVITKNNEEAEIKFDNFKLSLRPHL